MAECGDNVTRHGSFDEARCRLAIYPVSPEGKLIAASNPPMQYRPAYSQQEP